jgi:hypothetical protein
VVAVSMVEVVVSVSDVVVSMSEGAATVVINLVGVVSARK